MKSTVVADASPIFSLASISKINLLIELFDEVFIAEAVWQEIVKHEKISGASQNDVLEILINCRKSIQGENYLSAFMDYGESESVILYKEIEADYFIVDDKKAREFAESLEVSCVGTLGLLVTAQKKGFITSLKPLFTKLIKANRYFSVDLLYQLLHQSNENSISLDELS